MKHCKVLGLSVCAEKGLNAGRPVTSGDRKTCTLDRGQSTDVTTPARVCFRLACSKIKSSTCHTLGEEYSFLCASCKNYVALVCPQVRGKNQ